MNHIKGLLLIIIAALSALLISCGIISAVSYYGDSITRYTKALPFLDNLMAQEPSDGATTAISENDEENTDRIIPETNNPEDAENTPYPQDFITVDNSYFEDAVFLGDSRMQGFIKYCGISNLRAYAYVGLNVEEYFTKQVFKIGESKLSASEALELDRNFSKVYLMFGTNELGWIFPDIFIEKYGKVIDHIKECNPDAVIYIESVIPVSKDACKKESYLKNETVWEYNELLQQLALDKEAYYLDLASAVSDENGILPDDAASDGVHLNKDYVQICLEYMRTHAIRTTINNESQETTAK